MGQWHLIDGVRLYVPAKGYGKDGKVTLFPTFKADEIKPYKRVNFEPYVFPEVSLTRTIDEIPYVALPAGSLPEFDRQLTYGALGDASKVVRAETKEERVAKLLEDPGAIQKGTACYYCGFTNRRLLRVTATWTLICEPCALEHLDRE